ISPDGTRTMISTNGIRPSITITGPGMAAGTIAVSNGTAAGIAGGRRLDTTRTSTTRSAIGATGGTDTATSPSGQDTTGYAYDLDELPATASKLPIAALLGLLAVAALLAVRFLRS